jgi:signal recognition particle GTPase
MKKLMVMIIVGLMGLETSVQTARADNTFTVIKEYGVPCALSLGLSAMLVKNDAAAIGVAICAGLITSTYFNKKAVVDSDELKAAVDSSSEERDMKIQGSIDEKFSKMDANQKAVNDETRNLFRELLADRLSQMNDDLRAEVQKKMQEGDFYPELEKKIMAKIKEDVILEGRARSREIVEQCVEEAESQLVVKKYAVPDKGAEQPEQQQ